MRTTTRPARSTTHATRSTRRSLAALGAAVAVGAGAITVGVGTAPAGAAAGVDRGAPGTSISGLPHGTVRELVKLRSSLVKYRDPAAAVADGYYPTEHCAASDEGGMGYHYVKPPYLASIDPAKPPILLYAPSPTGPMLAGAEWFQADGDGDLDTDDDRPSMFGIPFDGPMEGHEEGMPAHYDLHVWLFKHNPSGLTAPWNPAVHC